MARIRTIKPEFWSHPIMGRLDDASKCLAVALLNFSDDEGFFLADPNLVRSSCRPFDDDSTIVRRCLDRLVETEWIVIKIHPSHGPIGRVTNFTEHQKIDRPRPSNLKVYFVDYESTNDRRSIVAGMEGNGMEEKDIKIVPAVPKPELAGGKKPKQEIRVVGGYSQEFESAMAEWRSLFKSIKAFEGGFPKENRHTASSAGSKEKAWAVWQKLGMVKVNGSGYVTQGDLLEAVKGWATAKIHKAENRVEFNIPMLSTMLAKDEFMDAVIHAVHERCSGVEHAS